jgi:spore maturation protein CgeB
MRVLVIGSGHEHSTFDLGVYYTDALNAIGVDAKLLRYDSEFRFAIDAIRVLKGYTTPETKDQVAKEYGNAIYLASRAALSEIVIFSPDIILTVTGTNLFPKYWDWLQRLQLGLKRPPKHAIILTESPYEMEAELAIAANADCVFTNERTMVGWLGRVNRLSFYLRHAYRPNVHYQNPDVDKIRDVYFCGSGHIRRLRTISLVDWSGIDFDLQGVFPTLSMQAPHLLEYYRAGTVKNETVADEYRRSRICLNVHRVTGKKTVMQIMNDEYVFVKHHPMLAKGAYSVNNRTIEVAACGSFQLCDDERPELKEIFGDSVATYSSAEELSDKVRFYLKHDDLRESMARQSLQKVQGLTYENNARKILATMEKI